MIPEEPKELKEWQKLHKFYLYFDYQTKDLAAYLKVSPRTIQRWIKGKTSPNKKKLNLIRKYLSEKTEGAFPPSETLETL